MPRGTISAPSAGAETQTQPKPRGAKASTQSAPISKPKSINRDISYFERAGGKHNRYIKTNGYRPHTMWIPSEAIINTDNGQRKVMYSEGASTIYTTDLSKGEVAPRKTAIQVKNGMLKIEDSNPLLKWYMWELVHNGIHNGGKYTDMVEEDLGAKASMELEEEDLVFENYAAIKDMSWGRAASLCLAYLKPAVKGEPLKALQSRLQAENKKNPQGFAHLMKDEGVKIKYLVTENFTTGVCSLNGNNIFIRDNFVTTKSAAASAEDTLTSYLLENQDAKENYLSVLEKSVEL